MNTAIRTLDRGKVVLQLNDRASRCRQCGAPTYLARNLHATDEWIAFNDKACYSEHSCGRNLTTILDSATIATSFAASQGKRQPARSSSKVSKTPKTSSGTSPKNGTAINYLTWVPTLRSDLQQRIDRARQDQTLSFDDGTHRDGIVMKTSLTLVAGAGGVTIDVTNGPAVTVANCDVVLDGFTIRSTNGSAILVNSSQPSGASIRLRNCTVEAKYNGLQGSGTSVRFRIEDSFISADLGSAIVVPDDGRAVVQGTMLSSISSSGIVGGSDVVLEVTDSALTDCGANGIQLGDRARLWMDGKQGVDITRNGGSGIRLGVRSQATIESTTIALNRGWGIVATDGRLDLERCLLVDNARGNTLLEGNGTFQERSPLIAVPQQTGWTPVGTAPDVQPVEDHAVSDPVAPVDTLVDRQRLGDAVTALRQQPALSSITLDDPRFRWVLSSDPVAVEASTSLDLWVDLIVEQAPTAEKVDILEQLSDYIDWLETLPLDQELASVVAPLVPAADVESVLTYFGWSGGEPVSFEETAARVNGPVVHVSRTVLDFIDAAQKTSIWTPTLSRVVSVIAELVPVDREELNEMLGDIGLMTDPDFSIDALFDAEDVMTIDPQLESIENDGRLYLIRRDQAEDDAVPDEPDEEGTPEPVPDSRAPDDLPASLEPATRRSAEGRLRKLLAVAGSVTLNDACEQLGRGTIDPIAVTPDQLRVLARSVDWLAVDRDTIRATRTLSPDAVLVETELTLVDLIRNLRPGSDTSFVTADVMNAAVGAGLSRVRTSQLLSNSPLFRRLDRGRYELLTCRDDLADGAEVDRAQTVEARVDPRSDENHFEPTGYRLGDLVSDIDRGVIGLPDLQRPFVWKADKIRDLFDSMYRGFPIGYLLLWDNPIPTAGRSFGARAEDGSAPVIPNRLVVDGQQRLTSLWATVTGKSVINADYERQTVRLAFDPLQGQFVVASERTARNPRYVPDISPLLRTETDVEAFSQAFLTRFRSAHPLSLEQRDYINVALRRLGRLGDFPLTGLVLSSQLTVEQVADIFVRINSKGVRLDQGDFVLTLMSVYWEEGRRQLEAFCRSAQVPGLGRETAHNPFITPKPTQLLTVAVSLAFRNARLRETHAVIGGEEKGDDGVSVRDERFRQLADAQTYLLDLGNWHGFFGALRLAGYVSGEMITSQAAILYSYAFYLIGRRDFDVPDEPLNRIIARWFTMASLTARYTSGANTKMDNDLAQLRGAKTAANFVAILEREIASVLTNDFWTITLPNLLLTTSTNNLAAHAYDASLNGSDAPALFGDVPVDRLFDPTLKKTERGVARVSLFSKPHLARLGITDPTEIKQVANLVIVDTVHAPRDMKVSPSIYMASIDDGVLDSTQREINVRHALPQGWETLRYADFLARRRAAMAEAIRFQFDRLRETTKRQDQ